MTQFDGQAWPSQIQQFLLVSLSKGIIKLQRLVQLVKMFDKCFSKIKKKKVLSKYV